jgi:hypothetical protein
VLHIIGVPNVPPGKCGCYGSPVHGIPMQGGMLGVLQQPHAQVNN